MGTVQTMTRAAVTNDGAEWGAKWGAKQQVAAFMAGLGLGSLAGGRLSARQIEAARMAIQRHVKRGGVLYCRVFPDKPVSAKPLETRMGKGKGEPEEWVACVRPGTIVMEIGGVEPEVARTALVRAAHKMPYRCRFVLRRHGL